MLRRIALFLLLFTLALPGPATAQHCHDGQMPAMGAAHHMPTGKDHPGQGEAPSAIAAPCLGCAPQAPEPAVVGEPALADGVLPTLPECLAPATFIAAIDTPPPRSLS